MEAVPKGVRCWRCCRYCQLGGVWCLVFGVWCLPRRGGLLCALHDMLLLLLLLLLHAVYFLSHPQFFFSFLLLMYPNPPTSRVLTFVAPWQGVYIYTTYTCLSYIHICIDMFSFFCTLLLFCCCCGHVLALQSSLATQLSSRDAGMASLTAEINLLKEQVGLGFCAASID